MTIRSTIAVGLHAFDQEITDMQNAVLELLGAFVASILSIANGGTNSGTALTNNKIMVSSAGAIVEGTAGTTTTVLHGNAAGAPTYAGVSLANDTAANQGTTVTVLHGNAAGQPSFAAVSLTTDVSGVAPVLNGGTGASVNTSSTAYLALQATTPGTQQTGHFNVSGTGLVGVLGVGTTTPGASTKLNVSGRGLFTGGTNDSFDSTAAGVAIAYDGTYGLIDALQTGVAAKPLKIQPSQGNTLINPNGGYVGIGATPATLLDVRGASAAGRGQIYIRGLSADGYLVLDSDTTTKLVGIEWRKGDVSKWQAYVPANSSDLRLYDGTADRVWFLNGGNVGIGLSPLTTLASGGGFSVGVVSKTGTYSATASDYLILCNANSGAFTVTLPAATQKGQILAIIKTENSINAVTISRAGADTIEGANTKALALQYDKISLIADGTSVWYDLGKGLI